MSKSGIHIKPENKGKFNATKKKTGKTTEELTHSKNPKTRKRAIFAQNARKWHHAYGGFLDFLDYANSYAIPKSEGGYFNVDRDVHDYDMGSYLPESEYFGDYNKQMQTGQGVANAVGQIPIVGAFKQVGEAGANLLAPKDQYGVSDRSNVAVGAAGFLNPLESTTTALNDIKKGNFSGKTAMQLLLPGVGSIMQNRQNKNKRGELLRKEQGQAIGEQRLAQYNSGNFALGGDLEKASELKGYGYNLMASGGKLPQGNSTYAEAKEFMKLYPKEMAFGTETEYEHTGNKKLAQRIAADHIKDSIKLNGGGEPDYYKKLQEIGISDELNALPTMAKGGTLSANKAKEILKDGTIRGKKITDRQRRYFGFISGGGTPKKAFGGPIPRYENILNSLENRNYAGGGDLPGRAVTTVHNNRFIPVTEQQFYEQAIRPYNDTLSLQQFNALPPTMEARNKYLPNSDWKIEQGKKGTTMNKGYLKYYQNNPIDMGTDITTNGLPVFKQPNAAMVTNEFPAHMKYLQKEKSNYNVGGYFGTAYSVSGGIDEGSSFNTKPVTEYKGGGTHEQNGLGGIPVGQKARVEEGEVRVDFDEGSYIFSNRF